MSLGLDLRGGFEILYEVKPCQKKVIKLTRGTCKYSRCS
ncbi:hypothetical protein ACT7DH_24825 [Bacillus pacificus]